MQNSFRYRHVSICGLVTTRYHVIIHRFRRFWLAGERARAGGWRQLPYMHGRDGSRQWSSGPLQAELRQERARELHDQVRRARPLRQPQGQGTTPEPCTQNPEWLRREVVGLRRCACILETMPCNSVDKITTFPISVQTRAAVFPVRASTQAHGFCECACNIMQTIFHSSNGFPPLCFGRYPVRTVVHFLEPDFLR